MDPRCLAGKGRDHPRGLFCYRQTREKPPGRSVRRRADLMDGDVKTLGFICRQRQIPHSIIVGKIGQYFLK